MTAKPPPNAWLEGKWHPMYDAKDYLFDLQRQESQLEDSLLAVKRELDANRERQRECRALLTIHQPCEMIMNAVVERAALAHKLEKLEKSQEEKNTQKSE